MQPIAEHPHPGAQSPCAPTTARKPRQTQVWKKNFLLDKWGIFPLIWEPRRKTMDRLKLDWNAGSRKALDRARADLVAGGEVVPVYGRQIKEDPELSFLISYAAEKGHELVDHKLYLIITSHPLVPAEYRAKAIAAAEIARTKAEAEKAAKASRPVQRTLPLSGTHRPGTPRRDTVVAPPEAASDAEMAGFVALGRDTVVAPSATRLSRPARHGCRALPIESIEPDSEKNSIDSGSIVEGLELSGGKASDEEMYRLAEGWYRKGGVFQPQAIRYFATKGIAEADIPGYLDTGVAPATPQRTATIATPTPAALPADAEAYRMLAGADRPQAKPAAFPVLGETSRRFTNARDSAGDVMARFQAATAAKAAAEAAQAKAAKLVPPAAPRAVAQPPAPPRPTPVPASPPAAASAKAAAPAKPGKVAYHVPGGPVFRLCDTAKRISRDPGSVDIPRFLDAVAETFGEPNRATTVANWVRWATGGPFVWELFAEKLMQANVKTRSDGEPGIANPAGFLNKFICDHKVREASGT